jgi:hypothetical protein
MKRRIQFLAEKGLTSMMMMHDFVSKCIAPLQDRSRPVWLYTSLNDTTRLEHGDRSDLEPDVLEVMLSKLSMDLTSHDFVTPLELCAPICLNQAMRSLLPSEMSSLDDIDLVTRQVGDTSPGVRIPGAGNASARRSADRREWWHRRGLRPDRAPSLNTSMLRCRPRMMPPIEQEEEGVSRQRVHSWRAPDDGAVVLTGDCYATGGLVGKCIIDDEDQWT